MKVFKIFENKILKNTISIILILFLIFDIIAPLLIINVYGINNPKNIKQSGYFEENFVFKLIKYRNDKVIAPMDLPKFKSIGVPQEAPEFLVGLVNVDYDTDEISKTIARCVFLGMNNDEIINEIKNKHSSRIKKIEINEYGKKRIVNSYEYYPSNENKIVALLDDLVIQREAKGGIAIIIPTWGSTIINETIMHDIFILKSKCINDDIENLGIISIDREKNYTLPNSAKLSINEKYKIKYYPEEGYEFDHWEVTNAKLFYQANCSNNYLIPQNEYGEIIAYYRKIGISITTTTTSSSIITATSKIAISTITSKSSSSARSTSTIIRTSLQSITSTTSIRNIETKTTITISTISSTSSIKQEKSILETIGDTITNAGKSILEAINGMANVISNTIDNAIKIITETGKAIIEETKKAIDVISETIINIGKKFIDLINNINPFKGNDKTTTTTLKITTTSLISTFYIASTQQGKTILMKTTSIKTSTSLITTPSKVTTSSSIKTSSTISQTKNSTTYKKSTTSIKTAASSSSYDIDKHIINSLNYYNNKNIKTETICYTYTVKLVSTTYKTSTPICTITTIKKTTSTTSSKNLGGGGGSPKGPLLRSALIFHKNVYEEFLRKVKNIENNKKLPMLYLVYKVTPLKIDEYPYYEEMRVYKIRPKIKNYDREDRKCAISIGDSGSSYGYFLEAPIVDNGYHVYSFYLSNILAIYTNEKIIYVRANGEWNNEVQFFLLPEKDTISLLPMKVQLASFHLYVYYNGESRFVDAEPEFRKTIELSFFGHLLKSCMIFIGEVGISIGAIAITYYCPPMILAFLEMGTQGYAEYIAYKEKSKNINELSEEVIKAYEETGKLIDVYERYKERVKPEIVDYIKGFLLTGVDLVDPINVVSGIILNDLSITFPGQIWNLLQQANDPNLSMEERARALGKVTGMLVQIAIVAKQLKEQFGEISKRFKELPSDAQDRIGSALIRFSKEDGDLAVYTTKLIGSALEKFGKEASDELVGLASTIKVLVNRGVKKDVVISMIKDAIEKIENGEIRDKKGLMDLADEILYDNLGVIRVKIIGEKYKEMYIDPELFEKIGGKIVEGDAYVVFEAFTEDGEAFDFIRTMVKVDTYDRKGRLNFGVETIYNKVNKNELFIKVKGMVINVEDFYNLFKEKIEKISMEDSIVEMISHNKIRMVNKEGEAIELDLKEAELHWISNEGALGIKGLIKIAENGNDARIAVCYDGEDAFMKIIREEGGIERGCRISNIEFDDVKLKITYVRGEERTHVLYFINPLELVKRVNVNKDEVSKIIKVSVNRESYEAWIDAEKPQIKGAIAELWGKLIGEFLGWETEGTAQGKRSESPDIPAKEEGKPCPVEVKSRDITGKSIQQMIEDFMDALYNEKNGAKKQILNKLGKGEYVNSEYGHAIIIGVRKERLNTNANEIEIDVLIVRVFRDPNTKPEIRYKPIWWQGDI